MQKLKRICVLFLSALLILGCSFSSYADVNDLMIGSDSNALMTMELDDWDYAAMPMSSAGTVVNTVSDSNIRVQCVYIDADGNPSSYFLKPEFENNRFSISCPQLPENCFYTQFVFVITSGSIPPVGGYLMGFDFGSHFSFDYSNVSLNTYKKINNANTISKSTSIPFNQLSGDVYFDGFEIDLTSVTQMNLNLFTNETTLRNFSGEFAWSFVRSVVSDNAFVSAGSDTSVQDYQSGVSSSLGNISSSVDTMTDEISGVTEAIQNLQGAMEPHYSNVLTQLHHITEQLHAMYDQVYNNIHLVELDILEGILAAIENMDLEVNVELGGLKQTIERVSSEIQANDNKLAAEQIANDEANTEEIKDAVEEHGNFIIDGLKGLFIPSDEFFKSYFDDLYEYFSDRFGFLSFPFDLLARFVDLVVNSSDVDCVLTLPSFEIMGEQLLYENSFNLTEFLEQNFGFLLSAIRMGTSIILIMSFVQLCGDKWKEVMNR